MTEVLNKLETIPKNFFMWLADNEIMTNAKTATNSDEDQTIKINGFTVKNSHSQKPLGAFWQWTKIWVSHWKNT